MTPAHDLHLIWNNGAPVTPQRISPDAPGAQMLAKLYAPPADRVHVRAMMNTTVDGAVAGADGTSGSLRNADDSLLFGVLRALCDVVLVGAATVRVEDYRRPLGRRDLLSPSRRPGGADRPALAIWTRSGDLPPSVEADWPTHLLVPPGAAASVRIRTGFPVEHVHEVPDAAAALDVLAGLGFRAIQAEGGPQALAQLADAGLLDELCFSVSHCTVGGAAPRVMNGSEHHSEWQVASLIVGSTATLSRYVRPSPHPRPL